MIIAIDGPAASGKSTVAKEVANKLGYRYISTGAMYRAVTLKAIENKIDIYNEPQISELAESIKISFAPPVKNNHKEKVSVDGEDVTDRLFTRKVDSSVSFVSRIEGVRKMMVRQQRQMAKDGDVVLEGRDIGTVVLPKADVKIFLTASAAERAQRRKKELHGRGHVCNVESLKREIVNRDRLDATRAISPLAKACDAFLIDTTGKKVNEVVKQVLEVIDLSGKK